MVLNIVVVIVPIVAIVAVVVIVVIALDLVVAILVKQPGGEVDVDGDGKLDLGSVARYGF